MKSDRKRMANRKVLIIDSNTSILSRLKENFERDNFQAEIARGIQEAQHALKQDLPNVIITEILLDDGDALQLIKEIKDNPSYSHIPIIALTSANDHLIEIKCLRHGVDDFFVKRNVTRQELVLKIEILLERFSPYNFLKRHTQNQLQGKLEDISLKVLLKMLCHSKMTGKLFIASLVNEAHILIENGEIKSAVLGTAEGLDAIFKIDKMKSSIFTFDQIELSSIDTNVDQSVDTIISLLED